MAASPNKSCHEMEGDQSQIPTKAFKEDLIDVMASDEDGTVTVSGCVSLVYH